MRVSCMFAVAGALLGVSAICMAQEDVILQPDEPASKDVFVYQFLSGINFDAGDFQGILGIATTNTGHSMHTLIEFDLSEVTLLPSEVAQATLNLYVHDGNAVFGGVYANPRPDLTVDADLYALQIDWDESTVTWDSEPPVVVDEETSVPVLWGSTVIDGIFQWISLDVTDLVKEWLSYNEVTQEGLANHGMLIAQQTQVIDPTSGLKVGISMDSSSAANKPFLEITAAPGCLCGDLNGDGEVTLADFVTFAGCFGLVGPGTGCTAEQWWCSDMSGDGAIDLSDFVLFAGAFGGIPQGSPPNCGS